MRLFITGISGLLGLNVALAASGRHDVAGCYREHPVAAPGVRAYALDVRKREALDALLATERPDVVLHTVGLSNVDACEDDPVLAEELNMTVARDAARSARRAGARFIHISTDHLFDGERPLRGEDDPLAPLNVYAKTKGEAEQAVLAEDPDALVVRTNFYGHGTSVRASFSDWILHGLREGRALTMFEDVWFTPVLINDLGDMLLALAVTSARGILHVAGGERVSKHDFAMRAAEVFGMSAASVRAVSVDSVALRAARPRDMSLACARAAALLGHTMPDLRDGLERLRALREAGWPARLQAAVDAGRA